MKLKWIITTLFTLLFLSAAGYILIFVGPALFAKTQLFSSSLKPSASAKPKVSPSPVSSSVQSTSIPQPNTENSSFKTYRGNFYSLQYPSAWGILTCINSHNIEFDPTNSVDYIGVVCDSAIKPISIILSNTLDDCTGDTIQIGNIGVLSATYNSANYTNYKWCTITSPVLNITNRISNTTAVAATQNSYASEIEEIIKSLNFTR